MEQPDLNSVVQHRQCDASITDDAMPLHHNTSTLALQLKDLVKNGTQVTIYRADEHMAFGKTLEVPKCRLLISTVITAVFTSRSRSEDKEMMPAKSKASI